MNTNKNIFLFFFINIFIIISFSSLCVNSQIITWNRVYGGPQPEFTKYGIQTFDGGYIIVYEKQNVSGGTNLLKLDNFGNEEWSRAIDTIGTSAVCIQQTRDSGFIIAASGNNTGILIKTDKLGIPIWTKYYSIGNESASFYKLRILRNGDYLICGVISFPANAYFVKTDTDGNIIWQKSFTNSTFFTLAYDITEADDYYYYTTGVTSIHGFPKTLVGKISSTGDFTWFKSYGSEGKGDAQSSNSIIHKSTNEIYLTGAYNNFFSTEAHFTKIDSAGTLIFQNVLPQTNFANSMCLTSSKNFAIAGGIATSSDDILFLLLNSSGSIISRKVFNSAGIEGDFSESIIETTDKGFFITGYTSFLHTSQLDYNIYAIKTDSLGSAPVNIKNLNNEMPEYFKLYQNYPNPFNSNTVIRFDLKKSGFIQLEVYELSGKKVITIIKGNYKQGSYEVKFEGASLSTGIYYYRLTSENYSMTRKMLQIK